uniref:Uncharacterized protein n=1 Tax=Myotis lucifugus TaxID=59463 RepID=G1Q816_MYOLU
GGRSFGGNPRGVEAGRGRVAMPRPHLEFSPQLSVAMNFILLYYIVLAAINHQVYLTL